ncbi:FadR/GntR family transcriptional regulator [Microbacterium awajiense]|uniref:FadR/GntR family transcriptional regulator n=1 Tax=Microbacterium awajiense TaxID=415214 RepID=A0ABP7AK90_9MICO
MSQTDNAIAAVKRMIENGEVKPGDRLPPERELGEALGVSRNSLREAVKSLEAIRVLDVRRGDGTYVTSLDPSLLLEGISFIVDIHDDATLIEMFGVRRILEAASARAAASSPTPDLLGRLTEIADESALTQSIDDLVRLDTDFHRELATAAGNRYLSGILETLSSSTVRARVWRGLSQVGAVDRTVSEHAAIIEAIRAGDAELAAALMTAHVAGVENWLKSAASLVGDDGADAPLDGGDTRHLPEESS